jgi:hypothetical protein
LHQVLQTEDGEMSALIVISEDKLWDLVRDAFEEGLAADHPRFEWKMARSRIQLIHWLEHQKKGSVA